MRIQRVAGACVISVAVIACAGTPRQSVLDNDRYLLNGPGPLNWTCDSRAGKGSQVHTADVGTNFIVTGDIHVLNFHPLPSYPATAIIGFYNKRSGYAVDLTLFSTTYAASKIDFTIGGGDMPKGDFIQQPNKESDFWFTLGLNQGVVSVSVAGTNVQTRRILGGLEGITLGCSNARVQFSNITITAL